MQRYLKRAIELLTDLALYGKKNPSVIPPCHTKSRISAPERRYFKRVSPRAVGMSASRLTSLLRSLEGEGRANIHNLLVIKDGVCVLEASAPGYDVNTFHLSHSMSKTVTGIAVGFLIEEGRLTVGSRLMDIFPEVPFTDKRFPEITVEHLLTMRTGVPFSELGTATEEEWTKTFFECELKFAPGAEFHYNSLNSYMLARIIERISGVSLTEYLEERLFAPLGIDNYLWELSPEGCAKGGFGLYMSAESWAKLGVCLLNSGEFEGVQVIPRSWILRSVTERSVAPESLGAFNYGYHIWVNRTNDEFLLNGMLGQNVWVCPKNNIVAVANCGNSELFQGSPALDIIRAHLSGDIQGDSTRQDIAELKSAVQGFFRRRHPVRMREPLRGLSYTLRLRSRAPYVRDFDILLGEYAFPHNNKGLLPLFVSVMQNNFSGGIEKMAFERRGEELIFICTEGGITREFTVGIYGFKTHTVTYGGETYIVNVLGEAMEDEDRNPVFKLEFVFPELPNSRLIKFTLHKGGRILVRMSETPNEKIATTYLTGINPVGKGGFAMGLLEKKLGEDFLERKLTEAFNPRLVGISTAQEGWEETITEENRIAKENADASLGIFSGLLSRFLGEDKSEREEKERRGFFGLFRGKKQEASEDGEQGNPDAPDGDGEK
ncbi:MAG: serine hydrolase [Clostridia bacterium]|nr:serine hydrolase [Clostridia bacterium]